MNDDSYVLWQCEQVSLNNVLLPAAELFVLPVERPVDFVLDVKLIETACCSFQLCYQMILNESSVPGDSFSRACAAGTTATPESR